VGDVEEFGLGVDAGSVDREQMAAFGGREFELFRRNVPLPLSLPLPLAIAMTSGVLIRIRWAANSATMPRPSPRYWRRLGDEPLTV
jgi:hypothetical protein